MENRRVSPARSAALSGFEERAKPDWGEVVGPTGPLGSRAHSATELHILGHTVESAIGAANTTPISAAAEHPSRVSCSGPESKTAPGIDRKRFSYNYFFEAGGSSTYHGQADF